jgi:WD40 repeat protein
MEFNRGIKPQSSGEHNLREVKPAVKVEEHMNSVDCLDVNPHNSAEFSTGSHDKTVKIWDAATMKSKQTLKGNKEGIWSLNYDYPTGKKFVTSSPEGVVKIWDAKSGKTTAEMRGHTGRTFFAQFNNAAT